MKEESIRKRLSVDKTWCAKCKICRSASAGIITFDDEGYPEERIFSGATLPWVEKAVEKCPASVLFLI